MAQSLEPESAVAAWLKGQSETEVARLKGLGQNILLVPVCNTGVIIDTVISADKMAGKVQREVVNRVECATAFNFDRVRQVLLSPPCPCPLKAGYSMLHVVLTIDSPTALPLLLGYMYDTSVPGNDLRSWLFVNKLGATSRHRVDELADVSGGGSGEEPEA
jgi:hypothetical protein